MSFAQGPFHEPDVGGDGRLPVRDIVRARAFGIRPAVARREIFEQLDPGTLRSPQRGDAQVRAGYGVQVLLLGTVVVARASNAHSQQPAVETQARIRVADDDRRVVDTEKERV